MSATDVHEIKLEPRYPESRHEDITDAFMRGHLKACETSFKAIEELEAMNKRLRKENDTLCHRIDELCRENEKLMGELADAPKCDACEAMLDCDECLRADGSHKERRRLSAENDKLRELVKAMTPFLCCMPFASCNTLAANVRERMRELGIEVDS
jgi:predicted RNase H-like nuclease (RuvC/YqgF family)